ncbi:MAG: hypothetical protein LJF30_22025 [Acidobacteria bacterium]|jgi:hypothetical protein|nr:hypothetical protein [Acidobacteriota bacterium]
MGRMVDLCGEVAAVVEEGAEGLVLPVEAREELLADWPEEDIEDALGFVTDSYLQSELVDAADSLSARLVEVLGAYGEEKAFEAAAAGKATLGIDEVRQLAHRLDRLEEILDVYRDEGSPDRQGFEALRKRLLDQGIEDEMRPDWEKAEVAGPTDEDEPEH